MVSVFLGAAALSAAVAGGYGLYRYWSRTGSVELSPKRPVSPPPVAPKPSLSSREEVIQSPEGTTDKTPPPVAPKPSLSRGVMIQSPEGFSSSPPVAPKPSSGLRNRGAMTAFPIKLPFGQPSPLKGFQGDGPTTFDEVIYGLQTSIYHTCTSTHSNCIPYHPMYFHTFLHLITLTHYVHTLTHSHLIMRF